MKSEEFSTLAEGSVHNPDIKLIFVEPKLSTEDFLCKTKTSGSCCFQNLQKIEKSYYPVVEDPVPTLLEKFKDHSSVALSNDGKEVQEIAIEKGKTIFIYFNEAKKADDFVSHDVLISKIYQQAVDANLNVLAIYTADSPSFVSIQICF